MGYRLLADALVLLHALFVGFVMLGGLLVLRRPRLAWLHVPAAAWGAVVEFTGWICPLTPLENAWRERAGEAGYAGGFVEHYLMRAVYPAGLARGTQIALGALALAVNAAVYWRLARRFHRMARSGARPDHPSPGGGR